VVEGFEATCNGSGQGAGRGLSTSSAVLKVEASPGAPAAGVGLRPQPCETGDLALVWCVECPGRGGQA
jgi:hypothetical protein